MSAAAARSRLGRRQIEDWLSDALVPVEPNPSFVRHLQARLVEIQGQGVFSPWLLILVLVAVFAMLATWIGVVIRVVFGLLSLLGLMERRTWAQARGGLSAEPIPLPAVEQVD